MNFKEYLQFEDIKIILFDILDPKGEILDSDNPDLLNNSLSDFKNSDKLLKDPALSDIINKSDNRESILTAIKKPSTTIGNLLSMLHQ